MVGGVNFAYAMSSSSRQSSASVIASNAMSLPAAISFNASRFGTVARLLEAIEYCEQRDIAMYGGGQFEIGIGRLQIQSVASLFYPDGPNDVDRFALRRRRRG